MNFLEIFFFVWLSWRSGTCFCNKVQRADSGLEVSGPEVQADGELLASAHNQTVHAVQVRAVVHVVEQVLQVPALDVQSFGKEKSNKKTGLDDHLFKIAHLLLRSKHTWWRTCGFFDKRCFKGSSLKDLVPSSGGKVQCKFNVDFCCLVCCLISEAVIEK